MTERGLPSVDGAPACPFVAFDDDRDERAAEPDHRHRCFAESPPAPRALAHQEAYCLSSAFPVCPVFQEWARREAARTRAEAARTPVAPVAAEVADVAEAAEVAEAVEPGIEEPGLWADDAPPSPPIDTPLETPPETPPRRNPPRDWAAPPPWATGAGAGGSTRDPDDAGATPDFLARRAAEGQGLVGSAADRLASGESVAIPPRRPIDPDAPHRVTPAQRATAPDAELAGLVGGIASPETPATAHPPRPGRRPTVSSTRSSAVERERERERDRARERERAAVHDGPSWERGRRFEAYPTIKTRAGLPSVPRMAVLVGALVIAAIALFFLPALLGIGGDDEPGSSPSPSAVVATPTPEPTPVPAPTPVVYTIKSGDTLSKIAREFDITLDQLLEANKDTIDNPDRIRVGDEIIIPTPPPEEVGGEESAAP